MKYYYYYCLFLSIFCRFRHHILGRTNSSVEKTLFFNLFIYICMITITKILDIVNKNNYKSAIVLFLEPCIFQNSKQNALKALIGLIGIILFL